MREPACWCTRSSSRAGGDGRDGVTTLDLDVVAEKMIREAPAAKPAFKGYYVPAPANTLRAVYLRERGGRPRDAVGANAVEAGDIVSIDTGVLAGWILRRFGGDGSGGRDQRGSEAAPPRDQRSLSEELAIGQMKAGNRLFDVCGAVERHVASERGSRLCGSLSGTASGRAPRGAAGSELCRPPQRESAAEGGHGPGDRTHGERGPARREGVVRPLDGGDEGRQAMLAHFEHSVAVTANGPWVLTRPAAARRGESGAKDPSRDLTGQGKFVELLPRRFGDGGGIGTMIGACVGGQRGELLRPAAGIELRWRLSARSDAGPHRRGFDNPRETVGWHEEVTI